MREGKSVSPARRIGVLVLFLMVLIVSFFAGGALFDLVVPSSPAKAPSTVAPGSMVYVVVSLVVGGFCLVLGAALYLVLLVTNGLTFDVQKPFLPAFKRKLFFFNIVVPLLLLVGAGCLVSMVATPLLGSFGVPPSVSVAVPFVVVLVVGQFLLVWVSIWSPLARNLVKKRLLARGLPEATVARAIMVGIADPSRSSLKKLTLIADDAGGLWIEPDKLLYVGDSDGFEITREQLQEVKREADRGSMVAYAGGVHPVLRFATPEGRTRTVRVHSWGGWTLGGSARSLKALCADLEKWSAFRPPAGSAAP